MWNICSLGFSLAVNFIIAYPIVFVVHWALPAAVYQQVWVQRFLQGIYTTLGYAKVPQTEVYADVLMTILLLVVVGLLNGLVLPRIPVLRVIPALLMREYRGDVYEKDKLARVKAYVAAHSGLDVSAWTFRVSRAEEFNAYSREYKRIVFLRPLLAQLSIPALAGIAAHEMGHLVHGDTKTLSVCQGFDTVGYVCQWLIVWAMRLCTMFRPILILGIIFVLLNWGLYGVLTMYQVLLQSPQRILQLFFSRRIEYRADAYAVEIGLGEELAEGLQYFLGPEKPWYKSVFDDHPHTSSRLERIAKSI